MRVSFDFVLVVVLVIGVMVACDTTAPVEQPILTVPPFLVELTWDQDADLDLHVWQTPDNQCSQDDNCSGTEGMMSTDDTEGTGPEIYTGPVGTPDGRYRVGVNLHFINPPTTAGPRTAMLKVTLLPGTANPQVSTYGPYTFTSEVVNGGYPVTGNTTGWWRPVDILVAGASRSVVSADNTPLNDPP